MNTHAEVVRWYNMFLASEHRLKILTHQYNMLASGIAQSKCAKKSPLSISQKTVLKDDFMKFLSAMISYFENTGTEEEMNVIETRGINSTLIISFIIDFCRKNNLDMKHCSTFEVSLQLKKLFQDFENIGFKKTLNGRKYYVFRMQAMKSVLKLNETYFPDYEIADFHTNLWFTKA